MKRILVLAGGGHAHLYTLANLKIITDKGYEVILISPSEHHYYSGMGPGMLGGIYKPEDIRFNIKKMAEIRGAKFIKDAVIKIDPETKTLSLFTGRKIHYNIISFNTGSIVPFGMNAKDKKDVFSVKPVENLDSARQRIMKLCRNKKVSVAIIGGGPAAAEIAGNIHSLAQKNALVLPLINIYCDAFMEKFQKNFAGTVIKKITDKKISIKEKSPATSIESGKIFFKNGSTEKADIIFVATGVAPSPVFKDSNMQTGPDGGMTVNRFLQSINHPEIFGGGDCIHFFGKPLDKAGVYAVRQAPVLFNNICAFIDKKPLEPFDPGKDYLMILNTGSKNGVLKKGGHIFEGKTAFFIKDYIDRKFMKKFQL